MASRGAIASEHWLRSSGLWAIVLLEVFVFVPFGAFIGNRYPDWTVMYLLDARELSTASWAIGLGLYPVLAIIAFFVARHFLRRAKVRVVWGTLAGAIVVLLGTVYLTRDALLSVGPYSAFLSKGPTLRPLVETQLAYLLALGSLALIASWGTSLWRVSLVSAATSRQPAKRSASKKPPPGPKTMPLRKKKDP